MKMTDETEGQPVMRLSFYEWPWGAQTEHCSLQTAEMLTRYKIVHLMAISSTRRVQQ